MSKYSVILPVRNGGEYVKECVNSILSQMYTDFDFIILDNCSTDGTLQWIQSLDDPRIKIIPADKDLSIEENWGRITSIEKNEFMTFLGHDDVLSNNFLQTIDELIMANPSAGLYHTHFNFIDAEGNVKRSSKSMQKEYDLAGFLQGFLTQTIDSMGTGYVMRSKDYDAIGGIPVKYPSLLFADFELWLNLIGKNYIAISPANCFSFRIHQSTTGTSQDKKLHLALSIFIDYLINLSADNKQAQEVIDKCGADFLLFYCKGFSHRLLRTPLSSRNGLTVKSFVEQTKLLAAKLGVEQNYHPEKQFSIKLALIIDRSSVLRKLFLLFKQLRPSPVYK